MPRRPLAILSITLVASSSHADIAWISAERTASAIIAPSFAADIATSNQLLGNWETRVACAGPWIPDLPYFERALASASHSSNIGLGAVPWASLAGNVSAINAFPVAFGRATATIRLDAVFTVTETTSDEISNLRGVGFWTEATVQSILRRGEETIFNYSRPDTYSNGGTLTAGTYSLTLLASFSDGSTGGVSGFGCDLRFTLPSPAAGVVAFLCGMIRRRRRP